jgi:tetratricopeptide (TPR) repeat protein
VRDEVAELRQAIASVGAQAAIGRYEIATTRSNEILARAEAIGFPPLLAQAKISVANVTSRRGDPARARPLLEEAYFLAAVAGADDVAAVATLRLVAVVGNDLGEPLTALLWGRIGLGHLERIGAGEDLRTAGILQNLGNVLDAEGRFDEALANYQRSLEIREAALGPDHPDLASSYTSLGLVYGSMRREEEARAALERAIALWTETFGPDHLAIAGALSTMSGIDHRMGNLAAAREDMERAIAIQERVDGPDHPEVASLLGNLAIVVQAQGDLDGAEKLYQRALTIVETRLGPEHPELAYPLDGIGSIALARGDAKTSLAYHRRAVAVGEQAYGSEHVQIVSSLRNLGLAQQGVGERAAAIATLERALAISEAHGRDDIDLSRTRYALALAVYPDDPARALTLATAARDVFAAHEHGDGPLTREVTAQLDAWRRSTGLTALR